MQAFVPGVVALSVEPVTSALPVNTPLPSTSPEPVLAELESNRIKVTANGELILKNTYTKTESDPDPETVTISIPIYKEVRQGGNTAPGKQTFTFVDGQLQDVLDAGIIPCRLSSVKNKNEL